ncbi:MAG TPA: hypothetical protein VJL58_05805, partial [Pyrinomonadaceae bacterium]|nr:hypothetical protein [Pyrinomonadaceae bacterium]
MFNLSTRCFAALCLSIIAASFAYAGDRFAPRRGKARQSIHIVATPWGPSQNDVDAAKRRAESSPAIQAMLRGTKYRLLDLFYVENGPRSLPPTRFRVVFYDYTNDRTIVATGDFAGREVITVAEESFQPIPTDEEFAEAVAILSKDPGFAKELKDGKLKAYPPMPDVTILNGTIERLVNVGIDAQDGSGRNEVISVSLKRDEFIRYPGGAPPQSSANVGSCGIPSSGQSSTNRGVAGQVTLTVLQGQTTLWEMLVIRPSASTGTRASGIEIRDVKYKGKSVIKRGHAPVLNVQYIPQTCGPYRDWQYAEGFFNAPDAGSQNPAPGIRILATGQIATTALESGNDTGNFQGVAIYQQNNETVMVSEMNAGWYRYIMEWRFAPDGTIRPRYGFGATNNSCVCDVHNHHVYWRFDFDIVQPNNKVFQVERGRRTYRPILTETALLRNYQTNRGLVIQNSNGDEAYQLTPNVSDGKTDTFGVGDLWVLQYKNVVGGTPVQNEIDDGINCTTCAAAYIQIDPFVNSESVANQDLVVWYGAHFIHNDGDNLLNPDRSGFVISGEHVVGPDLRPIR